MTASAPPPPPAARRGRPRSFDRAAALRAATLLFWRHGYEGTSIADLTRAMGISPPSLYAAFGDKRSLFSEIVADYGREWGAELWAAWSGPVDARSAFAGILRAAARSYTDPAHPGGCLVISAAVSCGPGATAVEEELRAVRVGNREVLEERLRAAEAAGELPAGADPRTLAVYFAGVVQGMSQQARDGAGRAELERMAELAMAVWPTGATED
ncbi:TetR/AcrR family transcriptional regulator [Streptomyces sp. BI20]|uniref:TetR/AcrR family transcriptional regulator n=1 Tax=Streptomyces sp. BI20 TaxID=3403460 RepID=UPI003C74D440